MEPTSTWSLKSWATSWFSFVHTQSLPAIAKEVAQAPQDDSKLAADFQKYEKTAVDHLKRKGIDVEAVQLAVASPEYEAPDEKAAISKKVPTRVRDAIFGKLEKDGLTKDTKGGKDFLLGRGGMGSVFRVKDISGKTYAVKLINNVGGVSKKRPQTSEVQRLKQEIEPFALATSKEDGARRLVNCIKAYFIQTTFDRGVSSKGVRLIENYYNGLIVMDYCDHSLKDVISHRNRERTTDRKLSEKLIATWFLAMAEGLAYLHSKKIAHKDIKPDNVLLKRKPGVQPKSNINDELQDDEYLRQGFELKLADYGISKHFGAHNFDKFDNTIRGTRQFMAPEMFRPAHERTYAHEPTDIWALGVTVWELVHFVQPFTIPSKSYDDIKVSIFNVAPKVARYTAWSNIDRHPPLLEMLLRSCLALDVNYRFTAEQIVQHVYFDILEDNTVDRFA